MATCIENCRSKANINNPNCYKNYAEFSFLGCSNYANVPRPDEAESDETWETIRGEAKTDAEQEPILQKHYYDLVLSHDTLESALANHLANKLCVPDVLPASNLHGMFLPVLRDASIKRAVRVDLEATGDRDPASSRMIHRFLYHRGFLACQAHRVAHWLLGRGRTAGAFTIQSRVSEAFSVDIHPAAAVGSGLLMDHATGVVIGETAVVGDCVSILRNVMLGGTGKAVGDRHPKIGDGLLVGAGTQVLGNVRIGEGAKVGAGSAVLKDVPAWTTAVGIPARLVGGEESPARSERMSGLIMDQTS